MLAAGASVVAAIVGVRSVSSAPSGAGAVHVSGTVAGPAERQGAIPSVHDASRPAAPLLVVQRDLFAWPAPQPAVRPSRPTPVVPPVASLDTAAADREVLILIGIAEDAGVRTAIITWRDQLFLVRAGERVADYRVEAIVSDGAELVEAVTGAPRRLAFR